MRRLAPVLALALCASVSAQAATYCTAPSGYLNAAGTTTAQNYGFVWMDGRSQHGIPAFTGGSAQQLTEVCFRTAATHSYTNVTGAGRKWTRLCLDLGHTRCATLTKVFSFNYLTGEASGTNVFCGAFSLPTLKGKVAPQVWDCCVKFSQPFLYNGKDDLLMDWRANGGSLANGATNVSGANYLKDGCAEVAQYDLHPTSADAPGSKWLPKAPGTGTPCSGVVDKSADAYTNMSARLFGDTYSFPTFRCQIQLLDLQAYNLKPDAPYVGVVSVGCNKTGVAINYSRCNFLWCSLAFPVLWSYGTTTSGGQTNDWITPGTLFPYEDDFAGMSLCAQTVWEDNSTTGQLGLSIAAKVVVPTKQRCPEGCLYAEWNLGSSRGAVGVVRGIQYHPVMRFQKK